MDVGAGALVLLRRGDLLGHQVVVPRVLLRRGELLGRPRGLIRPFINIFLKLHLSKYSIFRKNHIDDIRDGDFGRLLPNSQWI